MEQNGEEIGSARRGPASSESHIRRDGKLLERGRGGGDRGEERGEGGEREGNGGRRREVGEEVGRKMYMRP